MYALPLSGRIPLILNVHKGVLCFVHIYIKTLLLGTCTYKGYLGAISISVTSLLEHG